MSTLIDLRYTQDLLLELLNTPSPTGNTETAIGLVEGAFNDLGLRTRRTRKGALLATLPGPASAPAKALTGHVDTLGGIVKEIRENGRLRLSNLGGYYPGSIVGEYCRIEAANGRIFTGTVLLEKQSVHIHPMAELHAAAKELPHLEVRIDARTTSDKETGALGICVGDFVSWAPRAKVTDTGFIKSRHLDDKAGVATMLAAARAMVRRNITPAQTSYFFISNYEEVGHGTSVGIPDNVASLLAVDMGVVGKGQTGDEFSVSICAKDSSGPYDLSLRRELVALAQAAGIDHKVDVYANYASDGSAALRAGLNARVALIGPGVDSSHAYERTHLDGLVNTARLIVEFLK